MIAEFETRLATVLRGRLPAPLTGRVSVAPGSSPGPAPQVVLGTVAVQAVEPDLGSRRPEPAPGVSARRRVVRLACELALEVRVTGGSDRAAQMTALDALIYELEAPDLRDGSALAAAGDPGFLVHELRLLGADAALAISDDGPAGVVARAQAQGWFWPVGAAAVAGVEIASLRVRGGVLPIEVEPADPRPVAGGPAIDLTIRVRPVGALLLGADAPRPLLRLAAAVVEAGGAAPGAGVLTGGGEGRDGARVLTFAGGAAQVSYTPPAIAAHDELLVALDDGEGGPSVELGRLMLEVRAA